ncbi:hypothetical protein J3R30DRAFT_3403307 [Lentinula aciculospora]|uniref:Uncharacterized protein n=1 Tax=Lentinula aciculospora TaxID=153920 RepID=A0A9W9DQ62_9AGAR|nr:hypothetical protein J3R30DRAFT_3403307 [Lentinula aciculospora]
MGLIGSVVSLVTAIFSSVPRQATWYNFFISWIVYCTSYLLLFFAGHAYDGDPELYLCIPRSSLTHSISPFSAACALALVIQLYLDIQTTLTERSVRRKLYWRIVASTTQISFITPNTKFSSTCNSQNYIPVGLFFVLHAFIGAGSPDIKLDIMLSTIPVAAVVIFGTHKVGLAC